MANDTRPSGKGADFDVALEELIADIRKAVAEERILLISTHRPAELRTLLDGPRFVPGPVVYLQVVMMAEGRSKV